LFLPNFGSDTQQEIYQELDTNNLPRSPRRYVDGVIVQYENLFAAVDSRGVCNQIQLWPAIAADGEPQQQQLLSVMVELCNSLEMLEAIRIHQALYEGLRIYDNRICGVEGLIRVIMLAILDKLDALESVEKYD